MLKNCLHKYVGENKPALQTFTFFDLSPNKVCIFVSIHIDKPLYVLSFSRAKLSPIQNSVSGDVRTLRL